MENKNLEEEIENLPDKPGVYFFKNAQEAVIYVGKAKNLKKRVKNHFQKPDQHAFDFISQITGIDFIQTATENEALILEQQFIKKLQPRWNVEWKDDKNYFYISLTAEQFPRIYLTHQPSARTGVRAKLSLASESLALTPQSENIFGPFVSGREVKAFLREIRKALPYRTCRNLAKKPCFYQSLGLCVAPCIYKKTKASYGKMIATLKAIIGVYLGNNLRVECYDISNLSGTLAVGSMVVFENSKSAFAQGFGETKPNKNEYRKFKIKTVVGQNDVASLREVLTRRLNHDEWPKPDLILLDGGKGQLKAAKGIDIPVIALAKTSGGRLFSPFSKNYVNLEKLPKNVTDLLLQIRDEAHRFAISFNKQRRTALIK
jgi:excinuclease UvrABC nuclease subunit